MAPTLPLLILSLLTAGPDPGARAKSPSNAERAKKGLLPRRAAPSKVTYLAEAARTRSELREFPEQAEPPVVVESEVTEPKTAEPPAGDAIAAAPEPVLVAKVDPALVERAPAEPVAASPSEPVAAAPSEPVAAAPSEPVAAPPSEPVTAAPTEPVAAAPAGPVAAPVEPVAVQSSASTAPPPPDHAPAPVAPRTFASRPSADEEPEPAPRLVRPVAIFGERWVDPEGRIVVRLIGPRRVVLSESTTGTVDELPVVWAWREDHGGIVQIVEDSWGAIEVRRDPVGRFLAARPLPSDHW